VHRATDRGARHRVDHPRQAQRPDGNRHGVLAAGEANLGEGQLRELWQTVQRRHLTTFTPREAGGQTFDFGERRVRLEWVSRAGKAREAHDFSWIAPLENEADVRPLQRAAATAARGTVPGVLLAYFPN
jgi:hypothetical protein